jgi:hypothetical protein
VAGSFIGKKKTGILVSQRCGGEPIFRIEQNCARVGGQNPADMRLEFDQEIGRDIICGDAGGVCKKSAQCATLIDRQGGNNAAVVGDRVETSLLAGRELHAALPAARLPQAVRSGRFRMTYAFLLLLTICFQVKRRDFSAQARMNGTSDQSDFHFCFANGFQLAAGNTAVGYGFVHR